MTDFPWLTLLLVVPFAGALVVGLLPGRLAVRTGLLWSALAFAVSVVIFALFESGEDAFQLVERVPWIRSFGSSYHLGIDGISLFLVLLTTFMVPLCLIASWDENRRPKQFVVTLLAAESAILGVFLSLDLLLFYVFWEAGLIPMYLLIGIWGYERRIYATVKFFLFTLVGGLLMLLGIVALHILTGGGTFDYTELLESAPRLALGAQAWLFAAFAVAFAVKVPVWPLHTWLPDAHTEAPTVGSVVLAALMLKLGTYGFLRFALPLFPDAAREVAPWFLALAVVGILYGAAVSVVQSDLKRLVAYSSVSHLGFVMLGMFAFDQAAAEGATIQMVNHGLSTGALFFLVGMLYQRRHTRAISDFGGLASTMPVFAGVFLFVALSSLGLPGLNGFVGEFLVLTGSFRTYPLPAVLGTFGVVLTAVYLLWAYQRTFHGPVTSDDNRALKDLTVRERLVLYPIMAVIVLVGVWPQPLLERIAPSVRRTLALVAR